MRLNLFRLRRSVTRCRPARWGALLGVCLLTPSCASTNAIGRVELEATRTVAQQPGSVTLDDAPEATATWRGQSPLTSHSPATIQKTAYQLNADSSPIEHTGEPREFVNTPGCPQDITTRHMSPPGYPQYAVPGIPMAMAPQAPPFYLNDEYICDGGDEGAPIHYHGLEMAGLETEDTVVEYHDNLGERRVMPTNKVCIYAPRFAAVSSASAPVAGVQINKAAGAHDGLAANGFKARIAIDEQQQIDRPVRFDMRSRASGLSKRQSDGVFDTAESAKIHAKLINPFESLKFVSDGEYIRSESPVIGDGMHAAHVWSREQYPVIVGSDLTGHQVEGKFKAADYTGVKDPRGPGQLRVVKLADKSVAAIEETIEFTIRFDNLGGLELTEVAIIDNLTPRLEYVPDSLKSTIAGELQVEDNGEGSSKLTYRLSEALKGQTGGVITFQCVVR
ncbi:MAG: DUF11 domain-containing protein [Planctomycetota bacterium]|nr:MAG: DUF11 domain-containing protein [Planctomycetota bacterium]